MKHRYDGIRSHLSLGRNPPPILLIELEESGFDPAEQVRLVCSSKRELPGEEDVDDNTEAPHVHRLEFENGVDGQRTEYLERWVVRR